ncbi:hypothetical protein [Lacinutrix sp. Hel_I_90]|uniref:hypothetical protein n=1 Tax=Lacinutrix sp. Hel_I_90 TaxID=1249999 RepID=UPI0005C9D7D9|nr:hypothetical protein [Lacinutrix sp. Hel_I_90]
MADINWNDLAENAASQTDAELNTQMASLTSLNVSEINDFITQSKITNANAIKVLQEIHNATSSNDQKASAISNINNGVGFLIRLVSKVV